jgi:hypothetical protein
VGIAQRWGRAAIDMEERGFQYSEGGIGRIDRDPILKPDVPSRANLFRYHPSIQPDKPAVTSERSFGRLTLFNVRDLSRKTNDFGERTLLASAYALDGINFALREGTTKHNVKREERKALKRFSHHTT